MSFLWIVENTNWFYFYASLTLKVLWIRHLFLLSIHTLISEKKDIYIHMSHMSQQINRDSTPRKSFTPLLLLTNHHFVKSLNICCSFDKHAGQSNKHELTFECWTGWRVSHWVQALTHPVCSAEWSWLYNKFFWASVSAYVKYSYIFNLVCFEFNLVCFEGLMYIKYLTQSSS